VVAAGIRATRIVPPTKSDIRELKTALRGIASMGRCPSSVSMKKDPAALSKYSGELGNDKNLCLKTYLRGSAGADTMGFKTGTVRIAGEDKTALALRFDIVPSRRAYNFFDRTFYFGGVWQMAKKNVAQVLLARLKEKLPHFQFDSETEYLPSFVNGQITKYEPKKRIGRAPNPEYPLWAFANRGHYDFACTVGRVETKEI
jgi:hypothetical protein